MTENTTAAGTDIAQVAPGALALAAGARPWTVADLAEKLFPGEPARPETVAAPEPAKVTQISDKLKRALRAIPEVYGKVRPTESRKLEAAELKDLTDEAVAIATLQTQLGERASAISEIVRHHMDHYGAEAGLVDENTLRILDGVGKGHCIFARPEEPFEIGVEGYEKRWQQRFVKGKVTVHGDQAAALEADGKITHAEFLAITSLPKTRGYDEWKMADFIRKSPRRGLQILQMLTTRSAPGASLYKPDK